MTVMSRRLFVSVGTCACLAPAVASGQTTSPTGKWVCPPCGCEMDGKDFDAPGDCVRSRSISAINASCGSAGSGGAVSKSFSVWISCSTSPDGRSSPAVAIFSAMCPRLYRSTR